MGYDDVYYEHGVKQGRLIREAGEPRPIFDPKAGYDPENQGILDGWDAVEKMLNPPPKRHLFAWLFRSERPAR